MQSFSALVLGLFSYLFFCFADIIFIQSSKTRHIEELHESIVEVQEEEEKC